MMPKNKFDIEILKKRILPLLQRIMPAVTEKAELFAKYVLFKQSLNSLEKQLKSLRTFAENHQAQKDDLMRFAEGLSEGKKQLIRAHEDIFHFIEQRFRSELIGSNDSIQEHRRALDKYTKDCDVAIDCLRQLISDLDEGPETDFGFKGLNGWHDQRFGLNQLPRAPSSELDSGAFISGIRPLSAPAPSTPSSGVRTMPERGASARRSPASTASSRPSSGVSITPASTASRSPSSGASRSPASTASRGPSSGASRSLVSTAPGTLFSGASRSPASTASSRPSSGVRTMPERSPSASITPVSTAPSTPSSGASITPTSSSEQTKNDSRQKNRAAIIAALDFRIKALDDEISAKPRDLGCLGSRKKRLDILIARYREQAPEGECSPEVSESSCGSSDLDALLEPFNMTCEGVEEDIASYIKQQITQRGALREAKFKDNIAQIIIEQRDGSINLDSFFDGFLRQTDQLRSSLKQLERKGAIDLTQKQALTHLVSQHESCLLIQLCDFYTRLLAGSATVSASRNPAALG